MEHDETPVSVGLLISTQVSLFVIQRNYTAFVLYHKRLDVENGNSKAR